MVLLASSPKPVSGQAGAVSCTASLVTSFTPCLNFIINSTASPTADCCRSLGALVKASTGCACLILTGSVPLGVPINRTLAVTLPRTCNNESVPLQCRDTSALSPAPGPVADAPAPSLAPLPPVTPAAATPEPEALAPAPPVVPTATPPVSQGQTRPTVVPSSAWRRARDSMRLNMIIRLLAAAALVTSLSAPASGQGGGAASCTASLLASFTPCFSFLTNSTNGGSPPTQDCCRSLAALMDASTGCACLILTGGVPLGVPVNRTLAVSLPRACNSASVPLQCRDTSAQIPAPGPVADTPSSASGSTPLRKNSLKSLGFCHHFFTFSLTSMVMILFKLAAPATPATEATAPVSQGQTRPMVLPSSARRASTDAPATAAAFVLLLAVGAAVV
ncbi:hypothetical protein BAE44_0006373 [Dichanthelium oligosanthes]|uniref:Bifunctional inhibitor/plant lipid transfer protein/seed storage helical domain-containing protein n=1 Tax=Dichanthelium oligosanthes TaxID=888268 RepID=A0A1E5W5I2_9POAL|nr:hypothetical protein BAE44_0006373 [Dichanthelium oligosanthes]